ncbi:hypothetical protein C8A05DRAFT_37172 [Staphylotrichum tortipilum]|uniref:F-box domain-containing protein n=1 Tax=Staphylotrichum tortipilum TaxID=2831512 RepID=A0AAN6ME94_9PEZI|nr:hypothetical protein C8A05DRAFT_37172 [Staphylotrichum longicolle]
MDDTRAVAAAPASAPSLDVPVDVMVEICQKLVKGQTIRPSTLGPEATSKPDTWEETLEHFAALGNIARSSPRLEAIVSPFLYKSVKVSMNNPAAFVDLVRRLTEFPEFGAAVKDVVIEEGKEKSASLTPAHLDYIYEQATKAGLRWLPTTDDQRMLEAGWVLIDLLLVRIPKVQKLEIAVSRLYSPDVKADFGHRLPDSVILDSLKFLAAHPPNDAYPDMSKKSLVALLRHTPALTHLQIGYCERQDCGGIIQTPLPKLRDLHLAEGPAVDCADLAKFCPNLERLRIGEDSRNVRILATDTMFQTLDYVRTLDPKEMPESLPPWIANRDFSLERLLHNLLPLAPTLRELDIDWDVMAVTNTECFEILSEFRALRHLRLVFGRWPVGENERIVNTLPPVLRTLCLGGQGIRVEEIGQLVRARMREGKLPVFELFEYTPVSQEMEPDLPLQLRRMFRGTQVDCSERPNPPLDWTPYRYICNDLTGRPNR